MKRNILRTVWTSVCACFLVSVFLFFGFSTPDQEATVDQKTFTRTFKVSINFRDLLEEKCQEASYLQSREPDPFAIGQDETTPSWSFMEPFGVTLGPGCSAIFNREEGTLKVTNTSEQLRIIGEVVGSIPKLSAAEEKELVSSIILLSWVETEYVEPPEIIEERKKMDALRIPSFEVDQTKLRDVFELLVKKTVEADTDEPDPDQKGFHIILDGGIAHGFPSGVLETPVTLSLADVSLTEILQQLTEPYDCNFRVEEYAILIRPNSLPNTKLFTTTYSVPPEIYKKLISKDRNDNFADPFSVPLGEAERNQKTWTPQQAFENVGVTFPSGTHALWDESKEHLSVTITDDQLTLVEAFLESLDEGKIIFSHDSRFHGGTGKSAADPSSDPQVH